MNAANHLQFTMYVPSIMCKESCVAALETALKDEITGIDIIDSDPTQRKTIVAQYSLRHLQDHFGPQSVTSDLKDQSIRISVKDLLAKVATVVDNAGHMLPEDSPFIQEMKVVTHRQPSSLSEAQKLQGASEQNSITQNVSAQHAIAKTKKKGPKFSDVLMQHPMMKGLQAATMVLMILMIPIMLSAIYVVVSRPLKNKPEMAGM
jgi:hypothetical protein